MLRLVIILFFAVEMSGQNETSKWYFGKKAALDFLTNPPTILSNSSMQTSEGCSSISDASGNLLFYTAGDTVWNQQHQIMANGTGLFGNQSTSQSSIITKKPGSSNLYYVFTLGAAGGYLTYSIIDMNLAAGMGSVTVKNFSLYTGTCSERLSGCRHCNGQDIWIVIHEYNSNNFRSYLLTPAGVSTIGVVSSIGTIHSQTAWIGCMKISPNGKKIGINVHGNPGTCELYDFNSNSGAVSNSLILGSAYMAYGIEFSSDGSKLYSTGSFSTPRLLQWDLCAGSNSAIVASQFTIATSTIASLASLQLASNGKIYVASLNQQGLGVINAPNISGSGCNYLQLQQSLGTKVSWQGLPNFVTSLIKAPFNYTQDLGCTTVSFSPPSIANPSLIGCSAYGNTIAGMSWNFGDPPSGPNNTSNLSNPVHIYPGNGSYSVTLVISYVNCAPDTIKQTIQLVNPTITVNAASVTCTGLGTATAIVNQGGGGGQFSYTWSPSGQNTSVAGNLSPGTHTVTVKNVGGQCISTLTTNITIPGQVSAVTGSTLSCITGIAESIVSGGSGNYTYLWSPGSQTTALVAGLNPGTYTILITDVVNQCSFTKTIQVTTLPTPTISVSGNYTVCPGQSTTLTASGADTFSWSSNATSPQVILSPTVSTIYTVTGTYSTSPCPGNTVITITASKCLGVYENNYAGDISLYPTVTYGNLVLETKFSIRLEIFYSSGIILFGKLFDSGRHHIDIAEWPEGVYSARAVNHQISRIFRIIKVK